MQNPSADATSEPQDLARLNESEESIVAPAFREGGRVAVAIRLRPLRCAVNEATNLAASQSGK